MLSRFLYLHTRDAQFCSIRRGLIAALFTLASSSLWSQSTPSTEAIEEIQVTATRRPLQASSVPASMTLITREAIETGNLLTDALLMQPGVFLQQTTPGQGAAIIRGLKGSEVLHLVDGMRLNNAIFRNAPTQYLALVAPGTLDRIEIVRGAQTSLYGSDAIGGVVQAISRIPSLNARGIYRDASVAFDTADLAQILRASVDFGDDKLAALVSGEYLKSGNRRTGKGSRVGPSGYSSRGVRVAVAATPDEDRSLLFDLQYARQPSTPRFDELVAGFGQTEPSSSEFSFRPNERVFGHIKHVRNNWLLGATWIFDFGWQRIVDDRVSRNFQSDIRRHESNRSDLFGLTVNVSGQYGAASWIAGAEIYHDRVASKRIEENLVTGQLAATTSRFPDGSTMDQAAVYGNLSWRAGVRQSFSGGLRLSAINTEITAAALVAATRSDQQDLSADVGWLFDLTDHTQITASLSLGFRAPNVFDLGTLGERPGNRFNIPNPGLVSERATQLDVGVRYRGDSLDASLALFTLDYTDRISSVLTGDTTTDGRDITQSRNIDNASIYGIETTIRWQLVPNIRADLVLNFLRGEQADAGLVQFPADRIPPLNGKLVLRYEWTDRLWIEPYVFFAGRQNRLSPRDLSDSRIDPDGTDSWMTINVATLWQVSDLLTLTAKFENLLDREYRLHGSGIDAVGRSLFVSMRWRW